MVVSEIYGLWHKANIENAAGLVVLTPSGVVVWWVDGVLEQIEGGTVVEAIRIAYGEQYVARETQLLQVVRYMIKETSSDEPKGFAYCFPGAQVVIAWNDKTLEVWDKDAKLDAVLAQYAFQFTFQCLDQ